MSSFKSNENIHKKEDGSYYVVSANRASSLFIKIKSAILTEEGPSPKYFNKELTFNIVKVYRIWNQLYEQPNCKPFRPFGPLIPRPSTLTTQLSWFH